MSAAMKVLIVHAHNEAQSFSASMNNQAVEEFQAQSHEVVVSDHSIRDVVPFEPMGYDEAVTRALDEHDSDEEATSVPPIATVWMTFVTPACFMRRATFSARAFDRAWLPCGLPLLSA